MTILESAKLKEFADDSTKFDENAREFSIPVDDKFKEAETTIVFGY